MQCAIAVGLAAVCGLMVACGGAMKPAAAVKQEGAGTAEAPRPLVAKQVEKKSQPRRIVRTIKIGDQTYPMEPRHVAASYDADRVLFEEKYNGALIDIPLMPIGPIARDEGGYFIYRSDFDNGPRRDLKVYLQPEAAKRLSTMYRTLHKTTDFEPYRIRVLVSSDPLAFTQGKIIKRDQG